MVFSMKEFSLIAVAVFLVLGFSGAGSFLGDNDSAIAGEAFRFSKTKTAKLNLDADGDGFNTLKDCNDNDASINPDTEWYEDQDADGYGAYATVVTSCEQPTGYVQDRWDCNDDLSSVNPGSEEVCDGYDTDCDGYVVGDATTFESVC